MPKFIPLNINGVPPYTYSKARIPKDVNKDNSYTLFQLFFTDKILESLIQYTNEFAELYQLKEESKLSRKQEPTQLEELRIYIIVYIQNGVYYQHNIEDLWNRNPAREPIYDVVFKYIGLNRQEPIDRYFYISSLYLPAPDNEEAALPVFQKLQPLSDYLRQAFKKYQDAGSYLAINETIIRFTGRVKETVNIPSKPKPKGFKIQVLANTGYILDQAYYTKGNSKYDRPQDIYSFQTKDLGFSNIQAVILDLVIQQGISSKKKYITQIDNLFILPRLLIALADEGFRAAGTVRIQKTAREEEEIRAGTAKQKKILGKEKNRGLNPTFTAFKLDYAIQIEQGKLYSCLSNDNRVLQVIQKD